ncbi:hypothetical protein [Mucilaginibacter sp.]|uniref:glycosyltransferase n=1 Tax=Mucilaginibacter sp. TaxID=1882438 RepID=UPI003265B261
MVSNPILLFTVCKEKIGQIELKKEHHAIIYISDSISDSISSQMLSFSDVRKYSKKTCADNEITHVIFLSSFDDYVPDIIIKTLTSILEKSSINPLSLLIPYITPPGVKFRVDGTIQSFLISSELFALLSKHKRLISFERLAYDLTYDYLNNSLSKNLDVRQIGAQENVINASKRNQKCLNEALLVIPHKGSLKLLNRTLHHLNVSNSLPKTINICFDEKKSCNNFCVNRHTVLENKLSCYINDPTQVGPYLARHYSIIESDSRYIFFQDSDDISINSRFEKQIEELTKRKLDLIGSHEIRIDQFSKSIKIIRYPTNLAKDWIEHSFHPLFHPTSLITKAAYVKSGGFSTDRKFGNDTQFLLRAYFSLRIGNVDDFLYIRFKRPNSLTTSKKTGLGSRTRLFLNWIWRNEIPLIIKGHLKLQDSSLGLKTHNYSYKLTKIINHETKRHVV